MKALRARRVAAAAGAARAPPPCPRAPSKGGAAAAARGSEGHGFETRPRRGFGSGVCCRVAGRRLAWR